MIHVLNPETSHSPIPIFLSVGTPVPPYQVLAEVLENTKEEENEIEDNSAKEPRAGESRVVTMRLPPQVRHKRACLLAVFHLILNLNVPFVLSWVSIRDLPRVPRAQVVLASLVSTCSLPSSS